jgi:hypothetical protein
MALNISALRSLSIGELDEILELNVRPSAQREGILDDVREKVMWTHQRGGWKDPSLRETSIADTAGYLVPPKAYHRMSEFMLITAAWEHASLREATSVTWDELAAVTGQALQRAYAHAVRNLVEWAEQASRA